MPVREKLKGAQRGLFAPLAYRVRLSNGGTLVLCDRHLDALRARVTTPVRYTGQTFSIELCDHCKPE